MADPEAMAAEGVGAEEAAEAVEMEEREELKCLLHALRATDEEDHELLYDLGARAHELGDVPLAIKYYEQARALNAIDAMLLGNLGVALGPGGLADSLAIPIETQPAQSVQNRLGRLGRGTGVIRILDPQQELSAVVARKQPVEQRRARAANVQIPGGRGGETGDDGRSGSSSGHRTLTFWKP